MSQSFLTNLNSNMNNVFKYQEQLSSLKQVNRPSDDPLKVSKIIDLKNEIKQNDTYQGTINDAIDFTNVQDAALANATNSIQRIHTLTQQAANGTLNTDDRAAIKAEINSEVETMMDSLNTNFGGRYIFAGQNSTTKPFTVERADDGSFTGVTYNGTANNTPKEISRGVMVDLHTDGSKLENGEGNLSQLFNDLFQALDADDTYRLGGDLLGRVDKEMNNILNLRTGIGATQNRLTAAKARNEAENLNLETALSTNQDVDLAETYMQYIMEMTAYQASLNMGTRILQTNILDYIR